MERDIEVIDELNKKLMKYAYDTGKLRGTLKQVVRFNRDRLPAHLIKDIEKVLEETE